MMLVVTGVSTLIHLYSFGYMGSDAGYHRFFSYLNFFVFSMLVLVLAGNFFLLVVGWAFVGAASYLLISFWYRRTTATRAGMKAFVINVVGDVYRWEFGKNGPLSSMIVAGTAIANIVHQVPPCILGPGDQLLLHLAQQALVHEGSHSVQHGCWPLTQNRRETLHRFQGTAAGKDT